MPRLDGYRSSIATHRRRRPRHLLAIAVLVAAGHASRGEAAPLALCVNPGGTGGCLASIQAAVDAATSGSTIDVAAGTYAESVEVPLGTRKVLAIRGAGAATTVIDGGGNWSTVWILGAGSRVTLSGLTLQNAVHGLVADATTRVAVEDSVVRDADTCSRLLSARVSFARSTVRDCNYGIESYGGRLELDQVDVVDNRFTGVAAHRAIIRSSNVSSNDHDGVRGGRIEISDSTVADNGGIGVTASRLRLERSTVRGNGSTGVFVTYGTSRIAASTISGNLGSGIVVGQPGKLAIGNSTISSNSGALGGGIAVGSVEPFRRPSLKLAISSSTIAGNVGTIGGGGGIYTPPGQTPSTLPVLEGTILADNQAPSGPECEGSLVSRGANVIEDTTGCTILATAPSDVTGSDPALGPLQNNGGPTETHALLPASPALGLVQSPRLCLTDQRGTPRVLPCDAGAFEAP